ncbi:MAG: glycosyltransferase family 9 protein [Bryobacteraceae bacterium]
MPLLEQLPSGGRVLIVRLRSLGDCVLTTPAIQILHEHRPDLEIGVAVEPRFREVFTGNPAVRRILSPSLKEAAAFRSNLAINFHGGSRSMWLTLASLAGKRAGFAHYRHQWIYNARIPRAQEILGAERKVHTAEHLASAMFWLGVPRREIPRASLFAEPERADKPYAVLHALASQTDKTWPADRFAKVADALIARGLEPVFICGPGEEIASLARFRWVAGASLEQVKSLLAGAALFIGNDSGPAHMAAAFGIPVVVLFGSSDPVVWAPWKTAAEQIVGIDGIRSVPVDQVIQAMDRLQVRA